MPTMIEPRLALMPPVRRLVAALFALLILLFSGLAQGNLWVQDGGGRLPGPDQVLWKYNGKPRASRLHRVLDLSLPKDDPHAMWPHAGATPEEQVARVQQILAWVDAGAPRDAQGPGGEPRGWDAVAPVFTGTEITCGQCHSPGGSMERLSLDSFEKVSALAAPDRGIATSELFISAHNHFFVFAVAALLLSTLLTFTGLAGLPRLALILGAFAGPVLDIGGWFLTKAWGAPFHWLILAGGGMFGGSIATMAAVVLWESTLAKPKGPA